MMPEIKLTLQRLDESDEPDLRLAECVLEVDGRIECGGVAAGLLHAHYLHSADPASDEAMMCLWDLDQKLCDVHGELIETDHSGFRQPVPRYLDPAPGILCVHYIALRPPFRRMGIGREVMRQLVHAMADARTGLVLLDTTPLQHLPRGYDDFDEEVRELPWNPPGEDRKTLTDHFLAWGMHELPDTRFVMASPDALREHRAPQWPPCPVLDQWNTCVICGGWIDLDGHDWDIIAEGSVHHACDGGDDGGNDDLEPFIPDWRT